MSFCTRSPLAKQSHSDSRSRTFETCSQAKLESSRDFRHDLSYHEPRPQVAGNHSNPFSR